MTQGEGVSSILVACGDKSGVEKHYLPALRLGWQGEVQVLTPADPLPNLDHAGGLLLAGGADIHPGRWVPPEAVHDTAKPDEARDAREILLVGEAWSRGLPILGICRGEQVLNVARGGSMFQDIPSAFGCEPERHQKGRADDGPDLRHEVDLEPDCRLATVLGTTRVAVNSRHHQAVRRLGEGLRAVGWHRATRTDTDGELIEALEADDPTRWIFGVQWHPENLVGLDSKAGEAARRLFQAFGAAVLNAGAGPSHC